MAPFAVEIPVIGRSESVPFKPKRKPRVYGDEPLPVKLSDHAPKNARITGRIINNDGVTYSLAIGDVALNDVDIDEILDYVSPLDLEEYEHRQFAEEREVLKAYEADRERQRREKLERQRQRAKSKGVVVWEEVDDTDGLTGAEDTGENGHGRARPTYTHLFHRPKERRRRKRDPQTGELVPFSEDEIGVNSELETSPEPRATARAAGPVVELPKRRRRKRDKLTGELLPLSPMQQQQIAESEHKRRRRRRHPVTGELMPIGWRYHLGEAQIVKQEVSKLPPFEALDSVAQGHSVKRPRLAYQDTSRSSSPLRSNQGSGSVGVKLDVDSSDSKPADHRASQVLSEFKSPAKGKEVVVLSDETSSRESSPDPTVRTSITRPSARLNDIRSPSIKSPSAGKQRSTQGLTTSILRPSASYALSEDPSADDYEEESSGDEDNNLWVVEAILDHQYSDPATQPAAFGKAPIMLYRTKWVGLDELRWEPAVSFGDSKALKDYRRKAGLSSESRVDSDEKMTGTSSYHSEPRTKPLNIQRSAQEEVPASEDDDEEMEDGEFEFEVILSHHLSDPRTHPEELGKEPVMLYQVKWKGWEEPTWEPAESFADSRIVEDYHQRVASSSGKASER